MGFLGLSDAIEIAKTHPDLVRKALRLKKLGNTLMQVIGGRAVHPVSTRIGGFYRAPDVAAMQALIAELDWSEVSARLASSYVPPAPAPATASPKRHAASAITATKPTPRRA